MPDREAQAANKEMVSAPLVQRRREGLRLTEAGAVLPEESRSVLSLIDHGVSFTDTGRAGAPVRRRRS
jgi:DNA-binding transcriptional LysR family regulator